jgi:hypothetical protein
MNNSVFHADVHLSMANKYFVSLRPEEINKLKYFYCKIVKVHKLPTDVAVP